MKNTTMNKTYLMLLFSSTLCFSQSNDMELKLNLVSFFPKGGLGMALETPFAKRQSIVYSGAFGNQSFSETSGDYKNYRTLLVEYRIATGRLNENKIVLFGGPYIRHKYVNWKHTNISTGLFSFGPGNINVEARSVSVGLSAGVKTKLTTKCILEFKGGLGYMNRYYIKDFKESGYLESETLDLVIGISLGINIEPKSKK